MLSLVLVDAIYYTARRNWVISIQSCPRSNRVGA